MAENGRWIVWPLEGGVRAWYSPEDEREMRELAEGARADGIERGLSGAALEEFWHRQVLLVHGLRAAFKARSRRS